MRSQFAMCKGCDAKCCKIVAPFIFGFEREKFSSSLVFHKFEDKKIPLLKKNGKNCIFLKNNKCRIYQSRPFNCRIFPFDIIKVGKNFYWIVWDFCQKPKDAEKHLKNFEKVIAKIDKKELDIYICFTKKSKDFRHRQFTILRQVKWPK